MDQTLRDQLDDLDKTPEGNGKRSYNAGEEQTESRSNKKPKMIEDYQEQDIEKEHGGHSSSSNKVIECAGRESNGFKGADHGCEEGKDLDHSTTTAVMQKDDSTIAQKQQEADQELPNGGDEKSKGETRTTTRDEKRMEINRQRAKEIRKRKKKMLEDMQQQIIFLTLENNKLRTQSQMQQTEINLLRNFSSTSSIGGGGGAGSTNAMMGNNINLNLVCDVVFYSSTKFPSSDGHA